MPKSPKCIMRSLFHCVRAGMAVAVTLAIAPSPVGTAQAHSSKPHPFKDVSIRLDSGGGRPTAPTIFVGHDGSNFTHLVGEFSAKFRIRAKVKSGHRIYGWGVMTGDPTFTDSLPGELIGAHGGTYEKSLERTVTFSMDAKRAVGTAVEGIDPDRVQGLIDRCNSAFSTPPPRNENVGQIQMAVHAGFGAGKKKFGSQFVSWTGWYPADASSRPGIAHTTFTANVVCLSLTDKRAGELPPARPVSVDIRVRAKGDTCPKDTSVTAYIDYDRPATARFRVIHNGVEPKSAPIEIKARKVSLAGKTWYRVERLERYKLDPGKHTFRIKVLGEKKNGDRTSPKKTVTIDCPPFRVTSAWLSYKVEDRQVCKKRVDEEAVFYTNRPGDIPYRIKTQGGLVVTQGIAYATREGDRYVARRARTLSMGAFDQMMILEVLNNHSAGDRKPLKVDCLKVQAGTLDLRGFAPGACKGEAAFSVRTNMEGDVPYRLDCTGGRSWRGTLQVRKTGPATYIGVGTVGFHVGNNEQVSCALKSRKPLPVKVLALRGRKYACHRRAVEPGAKDLTVKPRSEPRRKRRPSVVLDPVRKHRADRAAAKRRAQAAKAAAAAKRKAAAKRRKRELAKKAAAARRARIEARRKAARSLRKRRSHRRRRAVVR